MRPFTMEGARCLRQTAILNRRALRPSRAFHSYERSPLPGPYSSIERRILSAALRRVPTVGFSERALELGAKDAGFLEVSVNLFQRGAFDLINFHLITQREALKDKATPQVSNDGSTYQDEPSSKVQSLTWERLRANSEIIKHWQDALAIMAQPSNLSISFAELAKLADEIYFLAGDTAVDTSWYTKRAALSVVYSATELYMTQDTSPDFAATSEFLDRRLSDSHAVGQSFSDVNEWFKYTGNSLINTLRSKGVRI